MRRFLSVCLMSSVFVLAFSSEVGAQETPAIYKFSGNFRKLSVWKANGRLWIGRIDSQGNFIPHGRAGAGVSKYTDPKTKITGYRIRGPLTTPVNVPKVENALGLTYDIVKGKVVETWVDKSHKFIPDPPRSEKVYEYRSGMLIQGELDAEGNFTPGTGSTVISIKKFKYTPDAPRIYNLPGTFVMVKSRQTSK